MKSNNYVVDLKQKHVYSVVMKQLRQYNLYNKNGEVIKFQKEAILG
jgi:hypothetical protein